MPFFADRRDGVHANRKEYISGYVEKARFVERRVLAQLRSMANENMIVVLHGDHGPAAFTHFYHLDKTCMSERMTTFLAIYADDPKLVSALEKVARERFNTVNIYRLILSHLRAEQYRPLESELHFMRWVRPDIYIKVDEARLAAPCDNSLLTTKSVGSASMVKQRLSGRAERLFDEAAGRTTGRSDDGLGRTALPRSQSAASVAH